MYTYVRVLIILCVTFYSNYSNAQNIPESLLGVWKFEIPGIEAIAIYSPTHAAWVGAMSDRTNLHGITPSTEDKARAYDKIWDVGISSLQLVSPSRCKTTFIHSHLPSGTGQSYTWDFEIKDGIFTYWMIQADGTRGYSGKARKLADWDTRNKNKYGIIC